MRPQLDLSRYDACPPYNNWLDERYSNGHDELDILGFKPRPSEVLFSMSPDTYEASLPDFMQQREEDIKDAVFQRFPAPIAYYFYRFDSGYENDLQRLHFLRDTWEAVVDVLHALAIAELRHCSIAVAAPLKFSDLFTDKISVRLENIERIGAQLHAAGVDSVITNMVSSDTIAKMRALNQERNAFSHSPAQSEAQARDWVTECYDDVLDILDDLMALEDIQIVRYLGQQNATSIRCDVFNGHHTTRTIKNISLTPQQAVASMKYFQQGQMLVIAAGQVFSLRPVVHYRDDGAGHTTRLCLFRKTRSEAAVRTIEYSVLGEAVPHNENRASFQVELNELRAQFGLEAE